jgi:hypothetical protein
MGGSIELEADQPAGGAAFLIKVASRKAEK